MPLPKICPNFIKNKIKNRRGWFPSPRNTIAPRGIVASNKKVWNSNIFLFELGQSVYPAFQFSLGLRFQSLAFFFMKILEEILTVLSRKKIA